MPHLALHLLGVPETYVNGTGLTFKRRRSTALLSYLGAAKRPQSRELLVSLLTDIAEPHASKHLSNALTELRQVLQDYVVVTRHSIAFNSSLPHAIDSDEFESELGTALDIADIGAIESALTRYRGDFLEGFALPAAPEFEEWQATTRERLRATFMRGLERVVALAVDEGAHSSGIRAATRYLALEPWSEDVRRQLMLLETRAGHRTAALRHYERFRERVGAELDADPELQTTLLYREIGAATKSPPTNLRSPDSPLVGRRDEIAHMRRLLTTDACRVVNVTGIEGVGKTRIAIEAAISFVAEPRRTEAQPFWDGVYFVNTATLRTSTTDSASREIPTEALASLICAQLGTTVERSLDAARSLQLALQGRSMLLLLDGVDEAVDAFVALLPSLTLAPRVKVVVTSRQRLPLTGQHLLEVQGLHGPQHWHDVASSDAGMLFMHELERVAGDVHLDDEELRAIAELCRCVDGNPRALILAAECCRAMSVRTVAAGVRLDTGFLANTERSTPHWTVRDVVGRLWVQLDPEVQRSLRCLTTFRGVFDHEAAQVVGGAGLRHLLALRDASLLQSPGPGRYSISPIVRRYVQDLSSFDREEVEQTNARHASYFARLVQRQALALLRDGADRDERALLDDTDDIAAAWEWVTSRTQVGLLHEFKSAITMWYELTGRFEEGLHVLERGEALLRAAHDRTGHDSLLALALESLFADEARFLIRLGARGAAREKLSLVYPSCNDGPDANPEQDAELHASLRMGDLAYTTRDFSRAHQQYEHARRVARSRRSLLLEAVSLVRIGTLSSESTAPREAED